MNELSTNRRIERVRSVGLVLVALASLTPWIASAQSGYVWHDVDRVVAFGDVHGAYSELVSVLEATAVIGPDLEWTGGETHLVSLGDLLDRGPESRSVMDLLMRLQDQAEAAGGKVHVILGNHELMDLTGDLRYVSADEYAAFAPDETPEMRSQAFESFRAEREAQRATVAASAGAESPPTDVETGDETADLQAMFDERYPPGYFAHQQAFSPTGHYGAWLLGLPGIIVIDDTAFVHGGLPSEVAGMSLDAFNAALSSDLGRFFTLRAELSEASILPSFDMQEDDRLARAALDAPDTPKPAALEEFVSLTESGPISIRGPLWYRGTVYCKPVLELPVLDAALTRLDVARVVVGHTPTDNRRVQSIYDGRLIMLDTGMLASYYHGRPAALLIENDRLQAHYTNPDETVAIAESAGPGYYGLADDEIHDVLLHAMVSEALPGDEGAPWQVELQHGMTEVRALFYPDDTGGGFELAAATLDDLIGSDLVPPTVARSLMGTPGALQLRLSDSISEARRLERQLSIGAWCPIEPQLGLVYSFDALIANHGRSAQNLVFSRDLSDIGLTAHGAAFGTERSLLPPGLDPTTLAIPGPVVDALRSLDDATVEAQLGQWLDRRRRRALLSRRDALLEGR